jgi:hypothetical protein
MRMLKTLLATIALVLLPLSAHANIIYEWKGTCVTTCTGQANFRAVTTDAYIPGEVFFPNFPVPGVLLEALYSDNNTSFDFAMFPINLQFFVFPNMPPNSSGAFSGEILWGQDDFRSNAQGVWRILGEGIPGGGLGCPGFPGNVGLCTYQATGDNGIWTRIPEPSSLVLLGVGLAGLASLRRRKVG